MSNDVQAAMNYAGSSLMTLNCMIAGLTQQLRDAGGVAAVEAAKQHALKVAKAYPTNPGVQPDIAGIEEFFNGFK